MSAPIDVSSRKQLFIDDRFIADCKGLTLRMNLPIQHHEPVLVADKPWEELGIGAYNTVFREEDGRWRMWYDALMLTGLPSEGARRLAYAESDNGIHWEKPELGLIEFRGNKRNNLVVPHLEQQSMQGATVFRDERASISERYKLWSKYLPSDIERRQGVEPGLWAMHSEDGIHWQYYPGQPNPSDTMCDTQNMFFWDDRLDCYVGYTRVKDTQMREEAAEAGQGRYRCVGRMTSPDFVHWSKLGITFEADPQDLAIPVPEKKDDPRPNIDFYTSCAMKYEHAEDVYLMFPSAFYHWGQGDYPATMDVQLLTSRDGIAWNRMGNREPFLRSGVDGSASSGMLFANPWLISEDDELWFYYSATARKHGVLDEAQEERRQSRMGGIYRSCIRRDGFVSADAAYDGAELITPPLIFSGDRLELNCDGSAGGWLQVEFQDSEKRPINGFTLGDADAMVGNGISKMVSWNGNGDVSALAGRPVRLRIIMRAMKLYAFQFAGS